MPKPKNEKDDKKKAAELKAKNGKAGKSSDTAKQIAAKKTAKKQPPAKATEKGPGFIQKTKQFFREVRVELKKVTWPSRKETMASTSVVIVLVIIVSVYLGIVDMGLSRALKILIK